MTVCVPKGRGEELSRSSVHLATFELDTDGSLMGAHGPACAAWGLTSAVTGVKLLDIDAAWTASLSDVLPRALGTEPEYQVVSLPAQGAILELVPAPWRQGAIGHLHTMTEAGEAVSVARLANLGRWTRSAIHMLNNSLLGILGYATLGRDSSDMSKHVHAFEQIIRGGTILRNRTHILLEYGRSMTPTSKHAGECKIEDAIESALRLLAINAPHDVTGVSRQIAPGTPRLAGPCSTVAQVLANLLENAYDAVDGEAKRIHIGVEQDGDYIAVSVTDDGSGLDEALLARAFTPFVTTKSGVDGVLGGDGLGLTLARQITEELGGQLQLSSRVGEGTQATLIWPIHRVASNNTNDALQGAA